MFSSSYSVIELMLLDRNLLEIFDTVLSSSNIKTQVVLLRKSLKTKPIKWTKYYYNKLQEQAC